MPQLESQVLTIRDKGIHCSGCSTRIPSVLAKMPGVGEARSDYKTQRLQFTLDSDAVSLEEVSVFTPELFLG